MATRFSNTLLPDSTVAANIRAWTQFVEDTLVTTGGWAATADTGQTLPSAMAATTAVNQKRGFRIYKMTDALQATAPVFMRVDYGSASAQAAGLWITIGTGSDGLGNITGVLWNGGASATPSIGSSIASLVLANNSYGSAGPGRACIALFIQSTSVQYNTVFCIERSKDAAGADTGAGLLLLYGGGISEGTTLSAMARSRYIVVTGGTQPTLETGLNYIISTNSPSQSFAPGDIGLGIVFHFKGVSQQPGMNMLITNTTDVSSEGQISLNLYGQQRQYQHLNLIQCTRAVAGATINDANSRVLMRYD